jgi:hypothetical protein
VFISLSLAYNIIREQLIECSSSPIEFQWWNLETFFVFSRHYGFPSRGFSRKNLRLGRLGMGEKRGRIKIFGSLPFAKRVKISKKTNLHTCTGGGQIVFFFLYRIFKRVQNVYKDEFVHQLQICSPKKNESALDCHLFLFYKFKHFYTAFLLQNEKSF